MKKALLVFCLVGGLGALAFLFFQPPARYLKKSTKKLIKIVDNPLADQKKLLSISSKVFKVAKYLHYDGILKLDYKGKKQQIQSLNELRSFLAWYFKQAPVGKISYDSIQVEMLETGKAQVFFQFSSPIEGQKVTCESLWDWLKEEQWFIKKIEIKNCS